MHTLILIILSVIAYPFVLLSKVLLAPIEAINIVYSAFKRGQIHVAEQELASLLKEAHFHSFDDIHNCDDCEQAGSCPIEDKVRASKSKETNKKTAKK